MFDRFFLAPDLLYLISKNVVTDFNPGIQVLNPDRQPASDVAIETRSGEITVRLPRWLDMDPAGRPIDAVGVEPDVLVKTSLTDFTDTRDPIVETALKELRKKG